MSRDRDPWPESVGHGAAEADPTAGERAPRCPGCGLPLTTEGVCLWRDAPDHHPPATPDAGDASERACQSRNPEPPHQRCENVVCDGNHRDYPNDPRKAETRWTDASASASEPLSEDVEALAKALLTRHPDGYPSPLQSDYHRRLVARALLASDWFAAREAKARAEAGEQALLAAAAAVFYESGVQWGRPDWQKWLRDRAARIAREVTS